MEYSYKIFIANNPDAILLAERTLHEELPDKPYMRIYYYQWNNNYSYIFRFEDNMVTNPISFNIPIPNAILHLFCYEWFLEYEKLTGIKEMFENNEDFYSTPRHMNMWEFARKWEIRFGHPWKFNEGEGWRDFRRKNLFEDLDKLKKNASKEELSELKKKLEEYIHAL